MTGNLALQATETNKFDFDFDLTGNYSSHYILHQPVTSIVIRNFHFLENIKNIMIFFMFFDILIFSKISNINGALYSALYVTS